MRLNLYPGQELPALLTSENTGELTGWLAQSFDVENAVFPARAFAVSGAALGLHARAGCSHLLDVSLLLLCGSRKEAHARPWACALTDMQTFSCAQFPAGIALTLSYGCPMRLKFAVLVGQIARTTGSHRFAITLRESGMSLSDECAFKLFPCEQAPDFRRRKRVWISVKRPCGRPRTRPKTRTI